MFGSLIVRYGYIPRSRKSSFVTPTTWRCLAVPKTETYKKESALSALDPQPAT